jgi:histidinol-phosphate aminotransferase
VIARSFSKAFGLAGVRCGYLLGSPALLRHVNKLRNGKDVNALAQVAAASALEDLDHVRAYVTEVKRARSWLVAALRERGHHVVAAPANFILLQSSDPGGLVKRLEARGIYVRDRSYLPQLEAFVRITVGTRSQCRRVVEVLDEMAPPGARGR